jgi:hypothetical protein
MEVVGGDTCRNTEPHLERDDVHGGEAGPDLRGEGQRNGRPNAHTPRLFGRGASFRDRVGAVKEGTMCGDFARDWRNGSSELTRKRCSLVLRVNPEGKRRSDNVGVEPTREL